MLALLRQIVLTTCVLLTLTTAALWYRTCRHPGEILVWDGAPGRHYEVTWIPGQGRFTVMDGWVAPQQARYFRRGAPPCYPVMGQKVVWPRWYALGVVAESRAQRVYYGPGGIPLNVGYRLLAIPLALPAAVFGFYPAWETFVARRRRLRRQDRIARGLCAHCGYEPRASPAPCPEGGKAASPNARPDGGPKSWAPG